MPPASRPNRQRRQRQSPAAAAAAAQAAASAAWAALCAKYDAKAILVAIDKLPKGGLDDPRIEIADLIIGTAIKNGTCSIKDLELWSRSVRNFRQRSRN
jgi:hypothetical protein